MQVNGIVGEGSPLFSLRGVSMFDYSLNQSSPVASYIDEVYKGNFMLFGVEIYDLERIEVLRGPRERSMARTPPAARSISSPTSPDSTPRPTSRSAPAITIGTRSRAIFKPRWFRTGWPMRFAFTYTKVDGFIQNVLPGHPDLEGVDQYGVRLSVLYKAYEDLNFILRYSKSMQDPQNYAIIDGRIAPAVAR